MRPPRPPFGLAHVELGDAAGRPTVIGLHGLAASGRSLRRTLSPIADGGARVLLPDLLGHGASPSPGDLRYDPDDHLAALESWAGATAGPGSVWLVGCSMGALLALRWAALRPERVRGVVAISVLLFESAAEARRTLGRGDAMAWLMLHAPGAARALCRRICGEAGPARRASGARRLQPLLFWLLLRSYGLGKCDLAQLAATRDEVEAGLGEGLADCWLHSWESLYGSFLRCIVEHRARTDLERLRTIQTPVLFIHGDRDPLAPIARVREAAAFGGWELEEHLGAVHALTLTHAAGVGRQVMRHLAGRQSGAASPSSFSTTTQSRQTPSSLP